MKFTLLLFLCCVSFSNLTSEVPLKFLETPSQENIRTEAFKVLTVKCNVCHATKKRMTIFTYENMDSLALEINKQVFVKKKMPKGKKNALTQKEAQALQDWVKNILEQ